MSPRKLTSSNKEEILDLYRNSQATTSTLADRYGVSSSTISRFLKSNLSEPEYEELIQQKRLGRTSGRQELPETRSPKPPKPIKKQLPEKSSSTSLDVEVPAQKPTPADEATAKPVEKPTPAESEPESQADFFEENEGVNVATLQEMLGEDLAELDEDEEVLPGDEDEWEDEIQVSADLVPSESTSLQVLPLSEASFPKTCYLVVDRGADLITPPLREFADLGNIPVAENQQKTLPVFDNQRVARRFSNRFQRVIKVPDGRLLEQTSSHLEAKGITRLLIDGKVYSLSSYDQ